MKSSEGLFDLCNDGVMFQIATKWQKRHSFGFKFYTLWNIKLGLTDFIII